MTNYTGRHRSAVLIVCQFGFDGCQLDGTEIVNPYELEVNNREEIVVACTNCEHELSREI